MKIRVILTMTILVFFTNAYADNFYDNRDLTNNVLLGQERGGGLATDIDGKLFLWDFVEAGIEDNVYINTSIDDLMNANEQITLINIHESKVKDLIVHKLNEIYKIAPEFALIIQDTFMEYRWSIVKYKVKETNDMGESPVHEINGFKVLQIANRDDIQKTISIDRDYWKQLDDKNKVGLLFHEVIYGLAKIHKSNYTSYSSRVFISHTLFNPIFEFVNFEELMNRARFILNTESFLNANDYFYWKSNEFKNACADFKGKINNIVVPALEKFEQIHNKYFKLADEYLRKKQEDMESSRYFVDTQTNYSYANSCGVPFSGFAKYCSKKIEIDGNEYIYFPANLHIPKVLMGKYRIKNPGYSTSGFKHAVKLGYQSKSILKSFKKSLKGIIKISKEHDDKFFGRCIEDPSMKELLKNASTVQFDN